MTILHIKSLNAEGITAAMTAYMKSKGFSYRKLIGQGYDGTAGKSTGLQRQIHTLAGHAVYALAIAYR